MQILSGINWLPVCADRNWDTNSGNVVCRELGFPGVERITTSTLDEGLRKMNVWKYSLYCKGQEKTVFDCLLKDDLSSRCHKLANVRCKSGKYYSRFQVTFQSPVAKFVLNIPNYITKFGILRATC